MRRSSLRSARSPAVSGARPGGAPRQAWLTANATSTCASSIRSGWPPSDVAQSRSSSASCSRQAAPSPSRGCATPVELSPCTTASALQPPSIAATSRPGSSARPNSPSTRTTSAPARASASAIRSPNMPATPQTTRSPGSTKFTIAASIPALLEPVSGSVARPCVANVSRRRTWVSSMIAVKAGSMGPGGTSHRRARTLSGRGLGPAPSSSGSAAVTEPRRPGSARPGGSAACRGRSGARPARRRGSARAARC